MEAQTFSTTIAGRTLTIETGKLAGQAHGAVTVRYGDTMVLATAVASAGPREGIDFFPLTVDFEARMYSAGKIPGGFIKREGRPPDDATLTMRMTDRALRPLFPKGFRNDVHLVQLALATDQENNPDICCLIGASASVNISDIPFRGPVSATRIGFINGDLAVNPTWTELHESALDMVVASNREAVVMVEAGATGVSERIVLDAIRKAHEINQIGIDLQEELIAAAGKKKREVKLFAVPEELTSAVQSHLGDRLRQALYQDVKATRSDMLDALRSELAEALEDRFEPKEIRGVFESESKALVRRRILEEGVRPDGRGPTDVRDISCEVGLLPRVHGSGLFTRGETQVLNICTLGSLSQDQLLDGISADTKKRFIHHYNFPPFSVGETGRMGPNRRAIGHGALAERAVLPVIPDNEEFPYTIRLVSEAISSNGSTSMASVCGSSLSLMDAGVPIKAAVSGVAMGLITNADETQYKVLTDIAGIEDAMGDMDFKVAGTPEGITAIQMDIKLQGLDVAVFEDALEQARVARLKILDSMNATIAAPRPELSPTAPRIVSIKVDPEKIRTIIGPGGKMIRQIVEQTGATIDVEDDGTVRIGSPNESSRQAAQKWIEDLTREAEIGKIYTGKVTRLMNFGAFVEILPGKDGLVHISELADHRVESVEDEVKIGDELMVQVSEIDRMGRINLSRRAVLAGETVEQVASRSRERSEQRGRRDGGNRGGGPPRGPRR